MKPAKYKRLFRLVILIGSFTTVCGFVLGYIWDFGLTRAGLTQDILLARALNSLIEGFLVGGILGAIPAWLALERFPENDQH